MGLNFRNTTGATVYVAYAYLNFNCRPVTYAKIGWYRVDPGQTVQVWSGFAGGHTFFYYAEDLFGRVWSGSYFTQVPRTGFHWCWDTRCATCRTVGMRRIYVDLFNADFTINLISSTSKGVSKLRNVHNALPTKRHTGKPIVRKTPVSLPRRRIKGKPLLANRVRLPLRRKRRT